MTHQYVGAYYVPHGWHMEYDPQFQYDPLSTVFYKNAWYILKQPAPVGTEPTNSQYWTQYNMIPGQIVDIENQISEINEKIDNLSLESERVNALDPPDGLIPLVPGVGNDNTTALNALENYCAEKNISLFIPAGRYYFDGTINKNPTVSWYGESGTNGTTQNLGIRGTILEYTGDGNFIVYPTYTENEYFEYAGLFNLNIRGNNTGNGVGLYITPGVRQLVFQNITIVEFSTGIYSQGAGELYFERVFIRECKYSANFSSSSDSIFNSVLFGSGKFLSQYPGIACQIKKCSSFVFYACRFQQQLQGNGCNVTNSHGVLFNFCHFDGNDGTGLLFNGGKVYTVEGCRFYGNESHGAIVQGNVTDLIFVGNMMENNDLTFYNTLTNTVIANNMIDVLNRGTLVNYAFANNIGITVYKEFVAQSFDLNTEPWLTYLVFGTASTSDISITLPSPASGTFLTIRKGDAFTNNISLMFNDTLVKTLNPGINKFMFTGIKWVEA